MADWPLWVPTFATILIYAFILALVWAVPLPIKVQAEESGKHPFDLRVAVTLLVLVQIVIYWIF